MKKLLKVLQLVFLVLCLGYLVYALIREGDAIQSLFLGATLAYLIPALLLWPLGVLVSALFAHQVINHGDTKIHFRTLLSIYLNRIPAKYLPGGVWQTFARAYDLNALGLDRTGIGVLVFYENFWTVVLAAGVSSAVLLSSGVGSLYDELALLMLGGVVALIPIAIIFRSNPLVLTMPQYLKITLAGLLFWLLAGTSFLLYLFAFDGVHGDQPVYILFANYLFSYVMGFISIFTPQGIGVFEFVMTQLTDFSIMQTQTLILLAGFRIIVLLGDMMAWLSFLVVNRSGWFQAGVITDRKHQAE